MLNLTVCARPWGTGKLAVGRDMGGGGGGARGGAAGGSGRARPDDGTDGGDYAAIVNENANAQLAAAAAEQAGGAHTRGGYGYLAKSNAAKGAKSNASLSTLDLADEETIRELCGRLDVSHRNERLALINKIELDYPRWWQLLQSEFSLLLYGFGSKKAVMEDFAHKWLMDGGVVVVNGGAVQVVSIKTLVESAPGFSALN